MARDLKTIYQAATVVEAEQATVEDALRTKQLLTRCGARLVGAIMNKYQEHLPNWLRRTLKG